MTNITDEFPWIEKLLPDLPPAPGLIVFDVDCTLVDATPEYNLRPGVHELFEWLTSVGYRIALWSGGGEDHVREVAFFRYLIRYNCSMYRKPSFPLTARDALTILGEAPLLIIDDDAHEAVPGWNFHHIEPFGPYEEPYEGPIVQQKEPAA